MSNNDDATRSTNDSASEDYAESSKIGTVGGGTAGALTGAAMGAVAGPVGAVIGGMAGALVGGTGGAVGDTLGEKAEDAVTGDEDGTMTSRGATRMGDTDASYTGVTAQDVTYGAGADTSYSNVNTSNMPVESLEATNDTASMVLPVVEEEIRIGKREVETGGVRLTSSISETPVSEQVSLHEERVTVERRPLDQALDASTLEAALQDATFEVRESAEEVVVQKDARIVGEVVIGKRASEHTETISDTVRRSDVQIEELPGVETTNTRATSDSAGTTIPAYTPSTEGALPVIQEEIAIQKQAVDRGGVRVTTNVTETPVEENVTLRQEEVFVERRSLDQAVDAATLNAFEQTSVELRGRAEEAVVAKDARIVEEVVVGKTASERTETISDTVRRSDVQIEELPATTRTVSSSSSTTSSSSSGLFGDHGSSTTTTTSSDDLGTTTTADDYTDTSTTTASTGEQQGGGLFSRLGNALERLTGADINRDGDVGKPGSRKK